jgi:hypothetical protein
VASQRALFAYVGGAWRFEGFITVSLAEGEAIREKIEAENGPRTCFMVWTPRMPSPDAPSPDAERPGPMLTESTSKACCKTWLDKPHAKTCHFYEERPSEAVSAELCEAMVKRSAGGVVMCQKVLPPSGICLNEKMHIEEGS